MSDPLLEHAVDRLTDAIRAIEHRAETVQGFHSQGQMATYISYFYFVASCPCGWTGPIDHNTDQLTAHQQAGEHVRAMSSDSTR